MNRLAIVIPFKAKSFKSRLSPVLGQTDRRKLAHMLLAGVLATVGAAGLSDGCYVVSSDEEALKEAESRGASGIQEAADAGVNSAVRLAMRVLGGVESFMVVPSDLPLLAPDEMRSAISWARDGRVVISPSSSFNGTNLLLFSRRRRPDLSYDNNSFWNHLASSADKRLPVAVYTGSGAVFDLDSPADARLLVRASEDSPVARFLKGALRG